MQDPSLHVEQVSVDALRPYARNARTHKRYQIRKIAKSIDKFGFVNPILIDDDFTIIAGHGRVEAAKLLGRRTVPAIKLSHLSEADRRAYVIADNKLALDAGWDREILELELKGLIDLGYEVELTGILEEISRWKTTRADLEAISLSRSCQMRSADNSREPIQQ
ncbi:MAG: ParB N-terminal domain-containing protein [Bradyrhizobiaceae bacterium]|nr:ParB N-terminal domain-containing protein [Bradyrhizobiaceae bacterium]